MRNNRKIEYYGHKCPLCNRTWGHSGCDRTSTYSTRNHECWECAGMKRNTFDYYAFEDSFENWVIEVRRKELAK